MVIVYFGCALRLLLALCWFGCHDLTCLDFVSGAACVDLFVVLFAWLCLVLLF